MSNFTYPAMSSEQCVAANSEIAKFRHKIFPYTLEDGLPGRGLEIASGGVTCVPWAWNLELPIDQYAHYNSNQKPRGPIQLRGTVKSIPVETESLFFLSASHILEDYPQEEWRGLMNEWARVVRHGGNLIISVPDHDLWWKYVNAGGVHNFAHAQPQPKLGDMSRVAVSLGLEVLTEEFTNCYPNDFTVLGVFRRP